MADERTMPYRATIALDGAGPTSDTARMDILARVFDAFQQATYVLAASRLGYSPNQRFKASGALRAAYGLVVTEFEPGSVTIPIFLEPEVDLDIPEDDARRYVLDDAYRAFGCIAAGNERDLRSIIPDWTLRLRFLREASRALPQAGEDWNLRYRNGHADWLELSAGCQDAVDHLIASPEVVEQSMTVIGDLVRINFLEKALWILYRPNSREIRCSYADGSIESILDRFEEPVQVTGRFILGDDGHPRTLSDVYRVEPVNLTPSLHRSVKTPHASYAFTPPLLVNPTLSDDQQLFRAVESTIGLDVFARSREELEEEIRAQIDFLWSEYVETAEPLSEAAEQLKHALMKRIRRT